MLLLPKQRAKEKVPDCGVEYRDVNRSFTLESGVRSKGKVLPLEEAHLPPPMRSALHSPFVFPLDLPFSSFRLAVPVLESYGYKLSVRLSTRSSAPTIQQEGVEGERAALRASRLFRTAPVYLSKTVQRIVAKTDDVYIS